MWSHLRTGNAMIGVKIVTTLTGAGVMAPHRGARFRANIRFREKGSRCLKRSFLLLLVPRWAHPWHRSVLRLKEDAGSVFTAAPMEAAGRMRLSSLLQRS